jgi:hypothetical protein
MPGFFRTGVAKLTALLGREGGAYYARPLPYYKCYYGDQDPAETNIDEFHVIHAKKN